MQASRVPGGDDTTDDSNHLMLPSSAEAGMPERLAGRLDVHLARFAGYVHKELLATSTALGLEVMAEFMAAEIGFPEGKHDRVRTPNPYGNEDDAVTFGGRLPIRRPRSHTVDGGEHEAGRRSPDLLADGIIARMFAGLFTCRYDTGLEPTGEAVDQPTTSTSKSAVSRQAVAVPPKGLVELSGRPLGDQHWPIVFIDGFGFGEHLMVSTLGVTADGVKVPLAVAEGSTENTALCARLVTSLADRGLDASQGVLFVVDGAKAITKAIHTVFDAKAVVQRCRRHKERNVLDHLPAAELSFVLHKLRAAWANPDPDQAKADLLALVGSLASKRPGAAASLREGLEQTLTVNRLGTTGGLLETVESTNPVRSMIEIVRDHSGQGRHWASGEVALGWAASGMLAAEARFRRVKGYKELPQLAAALAHTVVGQPG